MPFRNLKNEILELAKLNTLLPIVGIRLVYEQPHSTTQIHYCSKSKCSSDEFILTTLRYWASFVYDSDAEFYDDLEICKFIEISIEDAIGEYESITGSLFNNDELVQSPPKFTDFGKIIRCILLSDKWNYRSIFLETEELYIGCHWDTAE